jgi:hypothetical protein
MVKLPYGISNFESLVSKGAFYVDRTTYIKQLENLSEVYLFFLRPRRFGKSLWISILQHYYGVEYKDKFKTLFGKYYIGKNPTSLANSYLMLKFDFSGIDTNSQENTYAVFFSKVKKGIEQFLKVYTEYFPEKIKKDILSQTAPEIMLDSLFTHSQGTDIPKIYIIIDEYDHFTNELISFRLHEFKAIVGAEGFVRSFYERIKTATGDGVVDRFFATGVAPITLDSMTSGFNIGSNISRSPAFNEMMGFTEYEVKEILTISGVGDDELKEMMEEIQRWYNGYLFHHRGKKRLYNSDMVLYFAKEYQQNQRYPENLLDTNISSDYGKIGKLFRIGSEESSRWSTLQDLLDGKTVSAKLTEQFSFDRRFDKDDFLSLLFYMGLITIKDSDLSELNLQIPNEVIRELYYQYFLEQLNLQNNLELSNPDVRNTILELAKHNNPQPLIKLLENTLGQLSNRDWPGFDEKHLKAILIAYLHTVGIYHIKSEPELDQKYPDLLIRRRPPYAPPHQFMIELKFLHKKDINKTETVANQGRNQLKTYLQSEEIQDLDNLHAWLWVFVGTKAAVVEEIQ